MKPIDLKSSTYNDFGVENNDRGLKFEDVYHVRILKYKKILQKFISKFGLKMFLWFKKVKITVP